MDKLIDHLFSLGIPGFFLALALLYELAISLKLKFGRSWLYKEIRDNLQNPAARELLMHDLRARPSSANIKYVSFLLNSHNWLSRYLDSIRSKEPQGYSFFSSQYFIYPVPLRWQQGVHPRFWYEYLTGTSLPCWRYRVSLRSWHQYLTGRSFLLCLALATLYPLTFFLLRFVLSGNIEMGDTKIASLPMPGRWLLFFIFVLAIIMALPVSFNGMAADKIKHIYYRNNIGNSVSKKVRILIIVRYTALPIVSIAILGYLSFYYVSVLDGVSIGLAFITIIAYVLVFIVISAYDDSINNHYVTNPSSSRLTYLSIVMFVMLITIGIMVIVTELASNTSAPFSFNLLSALNLDLNLHLTPVHISFLSLLLIAPLMFVYVFSAISTFSMSTFSVIDKYDASLKSRMPSKQILLLAPKIFLPFIVSMLSSIYLYSYIAILEINEEVTAFFKSFESVLVFLLLIIALPPINAILDWLSLALSRYCFDKVLLHSRWTQWLYILLDLIGAIVTLVLLYTLIFWVLGRFELLFPESVNDVAAMRDLWWRSPWHPDVLWITIMGATTMLMTLLHIFTSLYGLFFWLPQDLRQRRRYARQLAAEAKRVPILPGEKYPPSELHHQIAHFLTIGRDRTIVWGFCIGAAMLSWIISLFYPHIPFLSASSAPLIEMPVGTAITLMLP